MLAALGFFVLGLLLLALGGDSLVKGASGLARRGGLSPFATGLVLVAFGTSLPELAVNLRAIAVGQPELALGNAIGSNVVNFGLVLGAAAVAAPLLVRWRALSPLLLVLVVGTAAAIVFGLDGRLSRIEGGMMLLAFVAVLAFAFSRARQEVPELRAELEAFAHTGTDLKLNLLRLAIALVLLYFGARFVVDGALELGTGWGLSPLLTGLVAVAIGTALPELAAAVAAARRGQGDIVLGHVVGSSVFNLLVIVGAMALWQPLVLPGVLVRYALPAALAFALVVYPMLRGDLEVSRREGGVLLAGFVVWLAFELVLLDSAGRVAAIG
ncbi:CaCA family Na+/Ca+ antiporter [Lysobacter arseniciresistens ZS79]|uniref:CaCA family Na+/Ca+ antiporter n=1 Tax=Lysobacter arseniciresistens ZS79 TaxID=913325 RepID=A0A0A0F2D3_9GAMM|nr:calcium/sodium antiporter [Lysobacter arseniciresistens]KGM55557.1 CaCA family Na+/Ca+ antiporter [Lysobacter arseniciresistens ZS79]